MTRKLNDLKELLKPFRLEGRTTITLTELWCEIAEKYGTSNFIRRSIITELIDFGFLKHTQHLNIYKIADSETPQKEKVSANLPKEKPPKPPKK